MIYLFGRSMFLIIDCCQFLYNKYISMFVTRKDTQNTERTFCVLCVFPRDEHTYITHCTCRSYL